METQLMETQLMSYERRNIPQHSDMDHEVTAVHVQVTEQWRGGGAVVGTVEV